jgi:hypothetical protein
MELSVKLEAALVAYLSSSASYPSYFVPADQVKPGEADEDIDNQYIRARADNQAEREEPLDTGNFWWNSEVELRTPAAVQTGAEEVSDDLSQSTSQLDKHQAIAAILESAILVSDLADQLNAAALALGAGYELTVFAIQDRTPSHSQDDVYSSGWTFKVYCCSRAF